MSSSVSLRFTRRDVLKFLGCSAGSAAHWCDANGETVAFPKGAIIRTVLKDYAPEDLGGSAVLFHEHLQLAADFGARFAAATAAARAANGLPPLPPRTGANTASTAPDIMHDVDS